MTRGERRARTERIIERRMRQARSTIDFAYDSNRNRIEWPRSRGHGRKKSHLNCGQTKCRTCHPEKTDKKLRRSHYERQAVRQGATP